MTDRPGLLASPLCQMAYVTNDVDAAMALFRYRHQVSRFLELRDFTIQTGIDAHATLHIALAYAGGVQIELLQPLGGADHVYRQVLRGSDGLELCFHHQAQQAASRAALDHLREGASAGGFPIVLEGESAPGTAYFYADCRATLGHHVEYIWYSDEVFAGLKSAIPVN